MTSLERALTESARVRHAARTLSPPRFPLQRARPRRIISPSHLPNSILNEPAPSIHFLCYGAAPRVHFLCYGLALARAHLLSRRARHAVRVHPPRTCSYPTGSLGARSIFLDPRGTCRSASSRASVGSCRQPARHFRLGAAVDCTLCATLTRAVAVVACDIATACAGHAVWTVTRLRNERVSIVGVRKAVVISPRLRRRRPAPARPVH